MVCAQDQPRGDAWVSTRPCGTPGLVNGRVGEAAEAAARVVTAAGANTRLTQRREVNQRTNIATDTSLRGVYVFPRLPK